MGVVNGVLGGACLDKGCCQSNVVSTEAEVRTESVRPPSDGELSHGVSAFENVMADSSQLQWVNTMMTVMWPHIRLAMMKKANIIFREKLSEELERHPEIILTKQKLDFDPGMTPPVLNTMRIYQRTQQERHGLQVDNDFHWTPDDNFHVRIDMAGRAKAFPINVEGVGIVDLEIRGTLSCLLAPLMDLEPCFGTGQAFFLDTPSIDMKMIGLKKLGPLAGLLVRIVESIISNVLAEGYILPHRFVLKVRKDLPLETLVNMKSPVPLGLLRVEVLQAKNLPAADVSIMGKHTSDPYVEVKIGFDSIRTSTIEGTLNPVWSDPPGHLFVYNVAQLVRINIHDDDVMGMDILGSVPGYNVYELCKKMIGSPDGVWLDVKDSDDNDAGSILIRVKYYDVCNIGKIEHPLPKAKVTLEAPPFLLTVKLLGLECNKPDRGDLRNARATVELIHPSEHEHDLDSSEKSLEKQKHKANRLLKGLEAAENWAKHKIKAATGLGFGHREDGIPMKRKSGKAVAWANQKLITDIHDGEVPALAIRAMEKLYVKEEWSLEDISAMFNLPVHVVKKAVDIRGNFEVVWHEALHFIQPASEPFLGSVSIRVDAPKNMVRGADSNGYIGSFDVDLDVDPLAIPEPWARRVRNELCRAKPKGALCATKELGAILKSQSRKRFRRKHNQSSGGLAEAKTIVDEENSGILLECIIEVRQMTAAECELDAGQSLHDLEHLIHSTKVSGVRLRKAD